MKTFPGNGCGRKLIAFFFASLFQSYTLPVFFGGVTLTDVNTVSDVKAIAVAYFLNVDEEWKEQVGDLWEKGFLNDLQEKAEIYAPDLEVRPDDFMCCGEFKTALEPRKKRHLSATRLDFPNLNCV
jgi:hypothetical protein